MYPTLSAAQCDFCANDVPTQLWMGSIFHGSQSGANNALHYLESFEDVPVK